MSPASNIQTTARASIGLPAARVEQIRSLADARGITTVALIEGWIQRDIAEGAPGATPLPGYDAFRDDNMIVVTIAGHTLPMMDELMALMLSTVLDGAAGTPNPPREFNMPTGTGVPLKLDGATFKVSRYGRGVVFSLETKAAGSIEKFAAPSSYITELATKIRAAVQGN